MGGGVKGDYFNEYMVEEKNPNGQIVLLSLTNFMRKSVKDKE